MNVTQAIQKLKKLKSQICLTSKKGGKARVEFVKIVFLHNLKDPIVRYELFDEYGLGERDFDTCFEMYDGDQVVHGLIKASLSDATLASKLKQDLNEESYNYWMRRYKEVERGKSNKEPQMSLGFS